ncbi:transcription-repair coupling factor [Pseudoflavonifractor sp. 60]|uniref:transcription-repair coupling factor n=1 Tax=Pseudoflavonifractor sp. 60 TaxID=2304576 RepID=UPI00136D0672|nr:transcription-repair coupling factor [Pseudoflavonifractor sp. 60]NBI67092.1 transcription-repair coupling factor [Pseudoflavonifractor sp. 60]
MKLLTAALSRLPAFQQLLEALEGGQSPAALSGAAAIHRCHIAAGIGLMTQRPVVVICADEHEGKKLARDLSVFAETAVPVLTARDFTFHNAAALSRQWEHRRLALLKDLSDGKLPFLVATIEGLLQRTIPPELLRQHSRLVKLGDVYDLDQLARDLTAAGYVRCQQVEGVGQFALRGGILDVFSPGMDNPVRVEFFGDEVDAMGVFDPATQRRTENIDAAVLLPAAEVLPQLAPGGAAELAKRLTKLAARALQNGNKELQKTLDQDGESIAQGKTFPALDRYLPLIYPKLSGAAGYFPADACVIFDQVPRVADRAKSYQWQLEEDVKSLLEQGELDGSCGELALTFPQLCALLENFPQVYLDSFTTASYPTLPRALLSITAKQLPPFLASPEAAVQDLTHYQNSGFACLALVSGEQRAIDLQTLLREQRVKSAVDFQLKELPQPGQTVITVGGLSSGFEYPELRLAVLTEGEKAAKKPKARREATNRQKLKSYADLSPGDLVVHEHYGVGRYAGMVKMPVDGIEKDYVKITYAGSDVLYVPATQLDLVSKYIGGGEDANETKKLNRLGGQEWEKAKKKAKKAVQDLAKGLIQLYAQRQRQPGYAFSPDSPWQREFEGQFEYTETDDQLRCIGEIKRDMERPTPMDRLLCGDVGYGKTEVAFRAMMKCVLDGKQTAILVPTTVLARQHYLTALRRFQKYPVNIDVVSRFRTPAQMKETLRKVEAGEVDILIGTHRLFNKDVRFKDLGLLVVDEEQRFGVQHKEKLKEIFKQVDVLTLSATPIPRTLNMALSGIRDMSTLEEPPADRQPVQTYVLEHDWNLLADAMRRELGRGGQVFYLHNRVETIDRCAARIQMLLGEEAAIGIAHGRMTQEAIDDVMARMTDGELNVLVCTTIIETGIDLPNVNTLIMEDADKLGLAQLHQIRGRVGRSNRRAFAYLTYRRGKVLSEVASKRLEAIREFAEFGSGFKIAMRDLEIRGAGNVLGPEQSGFLLSVGYDMYLKLLEEAVLLEQGQPLPTRTECAANLSVSASIPDQYVPAPEQRMDLYRRIAAIRDEQEADELVDELIDRYGEPPRPVNNLISVALLRATAARCQISDIAQNGDRLVLTLAEFSLEPFSQLCAQERYAKRLLLMPGDSPRFALRLGKNEDPLRAARHLAEDYAKILGG